MNTNDYLNYVTNQIHTVIVATIDDHNHPVTCAIDIMDYDDNGIYFLTAKGKNFYKRLKQNHSISISGLQGNSTLTSKTITIHGDVKEIGPSLISMLFDKNPYMYELYPTEESRTSLTVFQMYQGSGEFFDISVQPIFREQFSFGNCIMERKGLFSIKDSCIHCGKCMTICPQKCIIPENNHIIILQEHCLHCGNCYTICPVEAVEKE